MTFIQYTASVDSPEKSVGNAVCNSMVLVSTGVAVGVEGAGVVLGGAGDKAGHLGGLNLLGVGVAVEAKGYTGSENQKT